MKRVNNTIKLLIKISISLLSLYFVYTNINTKDTWKVLSSLNLLLLIPPFILYLISKYFTAERFRKFLGEVEINLSLIENAKLYMVGMYYNVFLPGGVSGDVYKAYYLKKVYKIKFKKLVALTLIDRISGVVAIIALAILSLPFIFDFHIFSLILLAGVPLVYLVYQFFIEKFFLSYKKILYSTNIQSMVGQLMQIFAVVFLLYVTGIRDQYLVYIFIFLISSVAAALPLTIGGIGARELTFIWGAEFFNIEINHAISICIIFYVVSLFASFSGIYFIFSRKKLMKMSEVNY